ncbi:MAG: 2-oxo acid dehydrogenase subunit E2 [Clostridia bacterium]|nr:2-oxo acid dehydrogenase subunit E2 [Clostridia bacterium]
MPETQRFGMQRKVISNMTSAGWRRIPHACFLYELDVTPLLKVLSEINAGAGISRTISFNTAMLKIIAEGIRACPKMNSHFRFKSFLVRGRLKIFDRIDATIPLMLGRDTMMTLKLPGLEAKSMTEIRDGVSDLIRRAKNTHLPQVLYETAMHDTLQELKRFRVLRVLGRLIGLLTDGSLRELLHGEAKRKHRATPATEKLTREDVEQGTVTISNPGSLYPRGNGECLLLEIIPPQTVAVAIGAVSDRPSKGPDGSVSWSKTVKLTVAFDHRALDGIDFIPFLRRIDRLAAAPEELWALV